MAEKELGERNFGFDSEVQIETLHGGERDCCRMRDSCQFTSGPCHFFSCLLKTSFLNADCVCCFWDVDVNRKWLYNQFVERATAPPRVADSAMLRPLSDLLKAMYVRIIDKVRLSIKIGIRLDPI